MGKRVSPKSSRTGPGSLISVQWRTAACSTKAGHESTACIKQVHGKRVRSKQEASVGPSYRVKVKSSGWFERRSKVGPESAYGKSRFEFESFAEPSGGEKER